jgi:hypothetical protein
MWMSRSIASTLTLAALLPLGPGARAAVADPNPVVVENQRPGVGPEQWDLPVPSTPAIEGFATDISYNRGETAAFKIKTGVRSYRIDIYRVGYYGGKGARQVATVLPAAPPAPQPACTTLPVDCSAWSVSATWRIPSDAVSGIYVAKLVPTDGSAGGAGHVVFVVRDDGRRSAVLMQTSDTTWQAYNSWGGPKSSLYNGGVKVSYDRPLISRQSEPTNSLFGPELSMVRFLERNGFDVTYASGVDTARRGGELLNHKLFLSVGHDEYWSGDQRANVEAARNAGVHLAFFSGNEVFWKTRWESGFRVMVCYKQTTYATETDPQGFTGTWRDARGRTAEDPAQPENALTGTLFAVNHTTFDRQILVPEEEGRMRLWRNTPLASQPRCGASLLRPRVLGQEWDVDGDNGFRPPGLVRLSGTFAHRVPALYGPGTDAPGSFFNDVSGHATHHMTLYRHASGALVFGAGTIKWANGLDLNDWGGRASLEMQQAAVNLFADMGVQPGSLQSELVAASASTDFTPPSSAITSPAPGALIRPGSRVVVAGVAADAEGQVGGVEVSVDGGVSWRRAQGRSAFRYEWMVTGAGPVTLLSRAVDDSGNLETPAAGVPLTIGCDGGCSLWTAEAQPAVPLAGAGAFVEVGLRFQSDADGRALGIRFYKGAGNDGPHRVRLWDGGGRLLATARSIGESASGWQSVRFAHPVDLQANTLYVASYSSRTGYSRDDGGPGSFAGHGLYTAPLRAMESGGVIGAAGQVPAQAAAGANFWVDVLVEPRAARPRGLFAAGEQPAAPWHADSKEVELGVRFRSETDGYVTGIRFWKAAANRGMHFVNLWSEASKAATAPIGGGRLLASATPLAESDAGWQTASFAVPVEIQAGVEYVASYHTATGYAVDRGYFSGRSLHDPPLQAIDSVYRYGPTAFPVQNALHANYWVEPVFLPTAAFTHTLWPDDPVPSSALHADPSEVEIGLRFKPDVDGHVAGVRFYKHAGNDGPHTGSLWTADGTELATGAFVGESECGWQELSFDPPVAVAAGRSYVVSYHSRTGYAYEKGFFDRQPPSWRGVWSPPLRALADGEPGEGPSGVMHTGPHAFPDAAANTANPWVDVIWRSGPPPSPTQGVK